MSSEMVTQVVVIGAGPAGYSAAFRCADLGLSVVLVERYETLGGVCLNVGCIPSKALLHIAKVLQDAHTLADQGVIFCKPKLDLEKMRLWKQNVVNKLTTGLSTMAKGRKITIIKGIAEFVDSHILEVSGERIHFEYAIIAAGSRPVELPILPYGDNRIWSSTDALALKIIPRRLLIMGGGIIGLEMATVYRALGSQVDVVEMFDQLIPKADKDIIQVFTKNICNHFNLFLETKVTSVLAKKDGIYVTMFGKNSSTEEQCYDALLVAVGRIPNGNLLKLDTIGIHVDEHGFIKVDKQMRTNVHHIFAVGDIVGQPMLAHKGIREGHIAAEVIAGMKHFFEPLVIPSIAYTDPEVAWVGLTEKESIATGIDYEVAIFPWKASGRAIASSCSEGMTKLIFEKKTSRVIGGAVVGCNGGELLGEIGLSIEMGCDVQDISLTIHAHPTLYESVGLAAELYEGSITDLPNPKAKKYN